eukprot:g53193.t1
MRTVMELKSSVAAKLEMMVSSTNKWQYIYKAESVCKLMWMRIHGVGSKVMKAAKRLVRNGKKIAIKDSPATLFTEDMIGILLCKRWQLSLGMDDTKGGVWKIQDLTCKSGAYQYVQDHWKSEYMEMINTLVCAPEQLKPRSVPCVDLVNKVWRMEFAHVKPIRDSDWAKDGICTLLAVEC